jgi:predicted ATPase
MIFKVKNLGYIKEAEVDLSKDLIVFTGHNNTGKTYLTYAIYSFYSMDYRIINKIFREAEISKNSINWSELETIIEEILNKGFIEIPISDILDSLFKYSQSEELEKLFSLHLEDNLNLLFSNNNPFLFKTSTLNFVSGFSKELFQRKLFQEKINIQYGWSVKHEPNSYKFEFEIAKKEKSNLLSFKSETGDFSTHDFIFIVDKVPKNNMIHEMKSIIYSLYENIFQQLVWMQKNVYIAPAERNAINIFSKELSLAKGQVIKSRPPNGLLEKNQPLNQFLNRYPQPIQDSLEIAEDLAHLSRNKSDFEYLAEELEQDFLKGRISTNQYGQIEYTPDNTDKVNLEIHLTASMVKSLSNIVFYLRHLAQKGDCIIIDEPELNLHPDNQRKIARFIGRLVNEGFQVVISTHSDYIIKELNNMIMLSKAKGERDDLIQNLGFRGDELLRPEQVEAQLFTLNSRKPEKIPITDEGFEVSTINDVIEQQDNDLEKIYYELFQKVM